MLTTRTYSGIAVTDMVVARRFYRDTLGIEVSDEHDLVWLHHNGDHRTLIYEQSEARPASYTVLNFEVDDIDVAVRVLADRGVHFERYPYLEQDDLGVYRGEGPFIAWFTDPAGNVLSVLQERR